MWMAWGSTVFGVGVAATVEGGYRVGEMFDGPPHPDYGLPTDAIDWLSKPGRGSVPAVLLDPQRLGTVLQTRPEGAAGGGGGSTAGPSAAEIAKAVNDDTARRMTG